MDYVNIIKHSCDYCLLKKERSFTIFDIWELFGVDWDIKQNTIEELNFKKAEREIVVKALELADGNISKAARLCNTDKSTFYHKMKKFDIKTYQKMGIVHKTGTDDI